MCGSVANREHTAINHDWRDDHPPQPRRHFASFAASILAHVALIALIFYFAPRLPESGHDWVLAYIVEMGGGGHGNDSAGGKEGIRMELTPMPGADLNSDFNDPLPETKPASLALDDGLHPVPRPGVMAALRTGSLRPHPHGARVSGDGGTSGRNGNSFGKGTGSGLGEGAGTGDGVGDGDSHGLQVAHADYGANPAPYYPSRSRNRAEQGTVILHVLIAADGIVEKAEVAESSGFEDLDDSALDTVLKRWRFVPAHRSDGHPVESWVLVPIKFALR